jgi:hypothetical protein
MMVWRGCWLLRRLLLVTVWRCVVPFSVRRMVFGAAPDWSGLSVLWFNGSSACVVDSGTEVGSLGDEAASVFVLWTQVEYAGGGEEGGRVMAGEGLLELVYDALVELEGVSVDGPESAHRVLMAIRALKKVRHRLVFVEEEG